MGLSWPLIRVIGARCHNIKTKETNKQNTRDVLLELAARLCRSFRAEVSLAAYGALASDRSRDFPKEASFLHLRIAEPTIRTSFEVRAELPLCLLL